MKNVIVRSVSGIVYIALIVGALLGGGWWFFALSALFVILATLEYQMLVAHRGVISTISARALDMAAGLSLLAAGPVAQHLGISMMVPGMIVIATFVLLRLSLALAQHDGDAFASASASVLGLMYISLPLSLLNNYVSQSDQAAGLVLCMFVLIWLNDTGAFCVGSLLGKHRLCERLSPKKSWEGFWGGMAACIAAAGITAWSGNLPIAQSIVFAVVVSVFSTWGDLFESLLKRTAHVKDSGHLIPGHGGILDRIDSLLFVSVATVIFAYLAL